MGLFERRGKRPTLTPEAAKPTGPRRPGPRGWTGPSRGATSVVKPPLEYRGATNQVAGLWPFPIGAAAPMVGVPIGEHLITRGTVMFDVLSWFRIDQIGNPSCFVLGLPHIGKSAFIKRQMIGLDTLGHRSFVLADIKGEYVQLVREMGGDVMQLGPGRGYINVLDPGDVADALHQLDAELDRIRERGAALEEDRRVAWEPDAAAAVDRDLAALAARLERVTEVRHQLAEDAHDRRRTMVVMLLVASRQRPVEDWEQLIVDMAIRILEERPDVPAIPDLLALVQDEKPERLRQVVMDAGDDALYQERTRPLVQSLMGLVRGGPLGTTFAGHNTSSQRRDRAAVYDLSALKNADPALQGAVQLACWSSGFATTNAAYALAQAGLAPMRNYFIVMDEVHVALRSGPGVINFMDLLTRTNRTDGNAQVMATHTMKDLTMMMDRASAEKAKGFVERAGALILGALPPSEMPLLREVVSISRREERDLTSWTSPAPVNPKTGERGPRPGRGKFLIKIGQTPATPVGLRLTPQELGVTDTNERFRQPAPTEEAAHA